MSDQIPEYLEHAPEKKEKNEDKERRESFKERKAFDWEGFTRGAEQAKLVQINYGQPRIYPFLLDQIGPDYTMGFFGKRREGKSFLMRNILYHMRAHFPRVYCFTNTRYNGFWQNHIPDKYIFDGYQPGVIQKIIDTNAAWRGAQIKHPTNERLQDMNISCLLILDDVINQDLFHSEQLRTLFYNGRHIKICLMIALQYAKGVPPGFRENFDTVFLFQQHCNTQIEAIGENFLGTWDRKTQRNILESTVWKDAHSNARQVLVVDQSGNSPKDSMLYWYHPQEVEENFFVGCREFWEDSRPRACI